MVCLAILVVCLLLVGVTGSIDSPLSNLRKDDQCRKENPGEYEGCEEHFEEEEESNNDVNIDDDDDIDDSYKPSQTQPKVFDLGQDMIVMGH